MYIKPNPVWRQVVEFLKNGAYIKIGKTINGKIRYYLLDTKNSPILNISESNFNKLLITYRRIKQNKKTGFYMYNPNGRRTKKNKIHIPKVKEPQLAMKVKYKTIKLTTK